MSKRIVLTGGGTGGHITPLLAVAHELKKQDPDCYVIYIGERNGKYAHLASENTNIDEIRTVFAGKFRRYHRESWLRRIFALRTNLQNIRDAVYVLLGIVQSIFLLPNLKPDMILLKGGFVGVPVGLAAAFLKKSFITHDSDALPGLANRLVSKWALYHATGMPPDYYKYPKASIRYVGVLVGADYMFVTPELQQEYKLALELPANAKVLFVTGGSGGAATINQAIRSLLPQLLEKYPDLYVLHQVGIGKGGVYHDFEHERLHICELASPMYQYSGAADVVVTRAGANTMAELGVQAKACIVIPNPLLTGGHQLKNATLWQENQAAEIVDEAVAKNSPNELLVAIETLLTNDAKRKKLAENLERLTAKNAAQKLATILLNPAGDETTKA